MKGQVEFVVIIGILVVAVVAVYFAWQSFAPPVEVVARTQEQKVVADSIENFIRAGALDTLRTLSLNGGYLGPQARTVTFLDKPVNYWQYQGSPTYPNFQANLATGIADYLRANKASIEGSLAAKNVTVGEPAVTAQVLANQVTLTVSMPTTMKGAPIPQPYTVTVQTKLGEIYDFSKALVQYTLQGADNRFLEMSVLNSMILSPFDGDVQTTPGILHPIYLIECGQYIFRDWWYMKEAVEDRIEIALAHTYMPEKVPLNTADVASYPKSIVPPLNGKIYDLDVSFFTPDLFALDSSTLQFTPNPISAVSKLVSQTPYCRSDPISVMYYFTFPAIVEVKDPLTDNLFRFAMTVYVKDTLPGDWADLAGYAPADLEIACGLPQCSASLTVLDSAGNPVPQASATFMGCVLGQTDNSGRLLTSVPCGGGLLSVRADGFGIYEENLDHSELAEKTIPLPKKVLLNLNLYEVVIENVTGLLGTPGIEKYSISDLGVDEIGGINYINSDETHGNEMVTLNLFRSGAYILEQDQFAYTTQAGTMWLDAGGYNITGALQANGFGKGTFFAEKTITEDMDGGELHIYFPYLAGFEAITDNTEAVRVTALLTRILSRCGIGPISDTPVVLENIKTATFDGDDVTCV